MTRCARVPMTLVMIGLLLCSTLVHADQPSARVGTGVTIGPYLQNPAIDGMTIMFCADQPGRFVVKHGPSAERLDHESEATLQPGDSLNVYKVRLGGLRPGTRYFYRVVGSGGEATPVCSLTTLNPKAETVTAVFFNDLHDNLALFEALKPRWENLAIDFLFFNGDCWADPKLPRSIDTLRGIMATCPANALPTVFVRGNHEYRGPWQEGLMRCVDVPFGQQNRYYFALTQGPVRFVCLDCGEDAEKRLDVFQPYREEELKWIKQEVDSDGFKQATYRVLVMHIPLYNENVDISPPCHRLWSPTLDKAGFDLCIAGHDHTPRLLPPDTGSADRSRGNPYPMLIGGGPAMTGREAGTVIVLEANREELQAHTVSVNGKTLFEYRTPRRSVENR